MTLARVSPAPVSGTPGELAFREDPVVQIECDDGHRMGWLWARTFRRISAEEVRRDG